MINEKNKLKFSSFAKEQILSKKVLVALVNHEIAGYLILQEMKHPPQINLKVAKGNEASINLYKKIGFLTTLLQTEYTIER